MSKYSRYSDLIWLILEPAKEQRSFPRPKSVLQLLHSLALEEETALVARQGQLLTPDRHIYPGDKIWVRIVSSKG